MKSAIDNNETQNTTDSRSSGSIDPKYRQCLSHWVKDTASFYRRLFSDVR